MNPQAVLKDSYVAALDSSIWQEKTGVQREVQHSRILSLGRGVSCQCVLKEVGLEFVRDTKMSM